MSVSCPITVQFEVREPKLLMEVASVHRARIKLLEHTEGFDKSAWLFLSHLAEGHGVDGGSKGSMCTWGAVGNYVSIEFFVEVLESFWIELYTKNVMFPSDGIIVMSQTEQRAVMNVVEISNDRTVPSGPVELIVQEAETPFPLFGWYFERPEKLLPPDVYTTTIKTEQS